MKKTYRVTYQVEIEAPEPPSADAIRATLASDRNRINVSEQIIDAVWMSVDDSSATVAIASVEEIKP